jgi:hypothetical protein
LAKHAHAYKCYLYLYVLYCIVLYTFCACQHEEEKKNRGVGGFIMCMRDNMMLRDSVEREKIIGWWHIKREAPERKKKLKLSESQRERGEGGGKKRENKGDFPQSVVSFLLVSVIYLLVGYNCAWLVGWLAGVCAVNRARGVRIRVCEDRSDVLFDLSAADHRRL